MTATVGAGASRSRRRRGLSACLLASALALAAPAQAGDAAAVVAWFDCEECTDGELGRVRDLGDAALPLLRRAAVDGAGEPRVARARAHYTRLYLMLREPRAESVGAPTAGLREFVGRYLSVLDERVRVRAAVAVLEISGPAALDDLPPGLREDALAVYNAMRQHPVAVEATPAETTSDPESAPPPGPAAPRWRR